MRAASSLAKGLIVVVMNPFITFVTATEPIDVEASTAGLGQTPPVVGHTDAVRRSALGVMGSGTPSRFEGPFYPSVGVTPSPAVKRRCGIRLDPGAGVPATSGVGLDVLARPSAVP